MANTVWSRARAREQGLVTLGMALACVRVCVYVGSACARMLAQPGRCAACGSLAPVVACGALAM